MATYYGKTHVEFVNPDETETGDDYTVPIPEGLTEEFQPSRPITSQQFLDWQTKGIEPYPGCNDEFDEWDKAWELVNRAQAEADGNPYLVLPTAHPRPDFDADGQPTDFDDPEIVVNPESGEATFYVDGDADTGSEADSGEQPEDE